MNHKATLWLYSDFEDSKCVRGMVVPGLTFLSARSLIAGSGTLPVCNHLCVFRI